MPSVLLLLQSPSVCSRSSQTAVFKFFFLFFVSFGPEFGLCMQLFLVPYSFFVHSSRRGVSRCKHFGRSQPVLILTGIFFPKINVLISRVKRMSEELLINLYVLKGFCVFFFFSVTSASIFFSKKIPSSNFLRWQFFSNSNFI